MTVVVNTDTTHNGMNNTKAMEVLLKHTDV